MAGIDKNSFKSIFEDHWDQFKQVHPHYDSPEYDQTVQKMLDCGNPEKMGFVQYYCPSCGEIRCIAFTCISCQRGFSESDITGFIAMYATKRPDNILLKSFPLLSLTTLEDIMYCRQSRLHNASSKALARTRCFVPNVATICCWS